MPTCSWGVCHLPNSVGLENIEILWNRRTPQPKQQPNPRKIRLKVAFWATFSHSESIFVGWDWFYIGNRVPENLNQPNSPHTPYSICCSSCDGYTRVILHVFQVAGPPVELTTFSEVQTFPDVHLIPATGMFHWSSINSGVVWLVEGEGEGLGLVRFVSHAGSVNRRRAKYWWTPPNVCRSAEISQQRSSPAGLKCSSGSWCSSCVYYCIMPCSLPSCIRHITILYCRCLPLTLYYCTVFSCDYFFPFHPLSSPFYSLSLLVVT